MELLSRQGLHRAPCLVTGHSSPEAGRNGIGTVEQQESMFQMLRMQLASISRKYNASGSWRYTGKAGAVGRDDIAMCLMLSMYLAVQCKMYHNTS